MVPFMGRIYAKVKKSTHLMIALQLAMTLLAAVPSVPHHIAVLHKSFPCV